MPPPSPLAPAGTAQWVERFLAAGAGAVVATNWPVSSAKAGQFAETLYRSWSSNRPLAVALSEARETIRGDGDPAWLSFALYGLPGARLGGI
jgi:CHAT domain-containing protein